MSFALLLAGGFAIAQPDVPPPGVPPFPEVAPPPHLAYPPVVVAAVPGGYQIALNRRTTDLLRDALDRTNEKDIAANLRQMAKEKKEASEPDEETAATLELIAFAVSSQLPGFKKALREQSGPGGAVVTLTGLQAPAVKFRKPRPRLERALEVVRGVMPLMPDDARAAVEAMRAVARTTPLFWKVEPRD